MAIGRENGTADTVSAAAAVVRLLRKSVYTRAQTMKLCGETDRFFRQSNGCELQFQNRC